MVWLMVHVFMGLRLELLLTRNACFDCWKKKLAAEREKLIVAALVAEDELVEKVRLLLFTVVLRLWWLKTRWRERKKRMADEKLGGKG